MAVKDYYGLMGIEREAKGEEIKKTYRRLVMTYHPDRNHGDPDCEERLREINEAYQVLGDEKKRRQYDLMCRTLYGNRVTYETDLNDELIAVLRGFFSVGLSKRAQGGCKGGGLRGRGCRRWNRDRS